MAKPKPVIIDGEYTSVPSSAKLVDVVSPLASSVVTNEGNLVPRSAFAETPVPEGFQTNLSGINKG